MSMARFPLACGFCGKPGRTYCDAACKQAWCAVTMLHPRYVRADFTAAVRRITEAAQRHLCKVRLP